MFTDFRIFGNFLICFRKFEWKSDTRHSFLEFVAKSGQNFITNSQKNAIFEQGYSFIIREKMLTIFAEIPRSEQGKKYVNLVDLVKSFPTSIYLQKSASIQPRTSLSKFGGKFKSLFIRVLSDTPPVSQRALRQLHTREQQTSWLRTNCRKVPVILSKQNIFFRDHLIELS